MNLGEVWSHLEEDFGSNLGSGRIQRRIMPGRRRDFFLGLEIPSRNRMLILRTSPSSIDGQTLIPKSHGVTVKMRDRDTVPPTAEVELILTDQIHRDIFDLLINDLVEAAEQPEDEKSGVTKFLVRLSDWQRLLTRMALGMLSKESQIGLWGELWTIQAVVEPVIGIQDTLEAWRGPCGADQDFQFPKMALEVKTSSSHAIERLLIASERQLDVPQDISLTVITLSLDARPGHGSTLPQMVQTIRLLSADSGCLQLFEERLTALGYKDEDSESYSDIGYVVRSRRQFEIRPDFPRITSGDLMSGISEVRYSVAVAACTSFEMNDSELGHILRRHHDNSEHR